MDAEADAQQAPVSYCDRLRSLLQRVADHAKRHSTKLFSGLTVLYLAVAIVMVIALPSCCYRIQNLSLLTPVFLSALYLRRRLRGRYLHAWLRGGLGYLAVASGALIALLFSKISLLSPATRFWMPVLLLVGACLALLDVYCCYRIMVLPLDEEEERAAQVQAAAQAPPPV